MKNKFGLTFIIASLVFTMLLCECFAAEHTVTREYISRKKGEMISEEENLYVDYINLSIKQGGYLKVSFIDNADTVIREYEMDISADDLLQNEMNLKSKTLQGTEYIKMEIISPGYEHTCIKLPFKI